MNGLTEERIREIVAATAPGSLSGTLADDACLAFAALAVKDPISMSAVRKATCLEEPRLVAAVSFLTENGCRAWTVGGRKVIGSGDPTDEASRIAFVAAALGPDETEVLAVVDAAGGIPKSQGARIFGYRRRKSFRPALYWLDRSCLVETERGGRTAVTAKGSQVLSFIGHEAREAALEPWRANAAALSDAAGSAPVVGEAMLTAVMGGLRLQPAFGDRSPAMVDTAAVRVLAAHGPMLTVKLIDMIGVPGTEVREALDRLEACGVASFMYRHRRSVAVRPDFQGIEAGELDPELVEAWLAALGMGTFSLEDFLAVRTRLGRGAGLRAGKALLAQLGSRGHLAAGAGHSLTATGKAFAEWLAARLSPEGSADRAEIIPAWVSKAVAAAIAETGPAGMQGPAAEDCEAARHASATDRGEDARGWMLPPAISDRRVFGVSKDFDPGCPAELSGQAQEVFSLIAEFGPRRVAEVAGATGRDAKEAAAAMADLAAMGLLADVSEGADGRSRDWRSLCAAVLDGFEQGKWQKVSSLRAAVPGSAFADIKAALRYLQVRGDVVMKTNGLQKAFRLQSPEGAAVKPPVQRLTENKRGPNWDRIVQIVSTGPVTQPEIVAMLGISSERVRQITDALVAEGRIGMVPAGCKGRTRRFFPLAGRVVQMSREEAHTATEAGMEEVPLASAA